SLASAAFEIARSIVSIGISTARAFSTAARTMAAVRSPFATFTWGEIMRESLPKCCARFASLAPFWRLICAHFLCPAIRGKLTPFGFLLQALLMLHCAQLLLAQLILYPNGNRFRHRKKYFQKTRSRLGFRARFHPALRSRCLGVFLFAGHCPQLYADGAG